VISAEQQKQQRVADVRFCVQYLIGLSLLIALQAPHAPPRPDPSPLEHARVGGTDGERAGDGNGAAPLAAGKPKEEAACAAAAAAAGGSDDAQNGHGSSQNGRIGVRPVPLPTSERARLSALLAALPLLPRHRRVCVSMAIKENIAARNYGEWRAFMMPSSCHTLPSHAILIHPFHTRLHPVLNFDLYPSTILIMLLWVLRALAQCGILIVLLSVCSPVSYIFVAVVYFRCPTPALPPPD
jgi:hypothetical protein